MTLSRHFISIDWGTTNFRLRMVQSEDLNVLFEIKNDQGIRTLFEQFSRQNTLLQKDFFTQFLRKQVNTLPAEYLSWPVVLSGMASSSIGLEELPYADFPFPQSGKTLIYKSLELPGGRKTLLISGVKSETGMMRGEETQAIGLAEHLTTNGILILPGTHSKHIRYEDGTFTGLHNFMTGEVFEVLSQKSILAASVAAGPWDSAAEAAFKTGLDLGFAGKLNTSLLLVRANHVIRQTSKTDNFYLLSGLLIGDELLVLKNEKGTIFLAASEPIFTIYKTALNHCLGNRELVFFDEKMLENALLSGQWKILELSNEDV